MSSFYHLTRADQWMTPLIPLQWGDALIAANALENGLTPITSNVKHFSPIERLAVERFDPAGHVH